MSRPSASEAIKPNGYQPRQRKLKEYKPAEPISLAHLPPLRGPTKEELVSRQYDYQRRKYLETRLIKARGKLQLLIAEARKLGMEHLLIEGE